MGLPIPRSRREAFAKASRFRGEFYACLTVRRDELSELCDAVLCADGPVKSLVSLTLLPEHRCGHGALYGGLNHGRRAEARAWDRAHPMLTHRSAWLDHDGELPMVEGTLVRLKVEHLSKDREAPPAWLWSSKTGATPADVDRWWQEFLRRFDLEHTFRFAKQTLGWTTPKLRTPEAADRWTWILIAAHTQLRLAGPWPPTSAVPGRSPRGRSS